MPESLNTTNNKQLTTNNYFPNTLSYLFHPLLIPTYGLLLLLIPDNYYSLFLNEKIKFMLLGITFLFTFLLPATNAYFLYKTGYISSLQMDKREERKLPYLVTCVFYSAEYYLLSDTPVPPLIKIMMLGATVSVLLTLIINLYWKISAHMIGIGGITGTFIVLGTRMDMFYEIILLIFISGLLGFSRLKLQKHSPAEIYAGYLVGFAANAGLLYVVFQK